ncbi:MAG TPA: 4Fe-4S dicluster domain-containing protein [Dissulfurispiraceae bacterium]|nr:4Fe-4S dicluster domain-containing protein [Dissulfurispiraceae bacterium]
MAEKIEEQKKGGAEQDMIGESCKLSSGISRRRFLATSILAGCSALGLSMNASASHEFRGWPKSYGMLTDFTFCVGCRSCEEACNRANGMPAPEKPFDDDSVFKESRWPSSIALTVVNRYENSKDPSKPIYRKVQCNHCLEPACASACPIHAYKKTPEGAVVYDADLCFGCRYCVIACPFNIPGYDYESAVEPKIVKCILCHGRLRKGQLPACAEACPTGAVTFGRRNDLLRLARQRIANNPEKYEDHIYGEHEVGGTSWLYISGVPFEQLGFPVDLPKKPLVELTEGYLSSVPVIFTTFPAIFGLVYGAMRHRDRSAPKEEPDQPREDSNE